MQHPMPAATLRLTAPPPPPPAPELDAQQATAVGWAPDAGHLLVVGAPGTGKTTTATAAFLARAQAADAADAGATVLLVPTRRGAARARDAVARRLGRTTGEVLVRTPASFAYSVLRMRAALLHEPAPTLITGPEQDLILAELLAGHRAGQGAAVRWPDGIGPDTLALPAFRAELRDLFMRSAELGLGPAELAERGRQYGRPEWTAAAAALQEYQEVTALGEVTPDRGARLDAARIVDEATAALLAWTEEVPGHPRPRWSSVVVDDYQDSTLATARLLGVLADDGAQLLLLGDPDAGVQGFRGGTPALVARAETTEPLGGFSASRLVLERVYRGTARLRAATAAVTGQVASSGVVGHRRAAAAPAGAGDPAGHDRPTVGQAGGERPAAPRGVAVEVLRSRAQEGAFIARQLREEHLHHGTAWSQMVVVVRSAAQVGAVQRALRTWRVPAGAAAGPGVLREEPAVRPLLLALTAAVAGVPDEEQATELLLSPVGGLDAVGLRVLRRELRGREHAAGGTRSPGELLVAALAPPPADLPAGAPAAGTTPSATEASATEASAAGAGTTAGTAAAAPEPGPPAGSPDLTADLPTRVGRATARVRTVLAAGRAALARPGATAETVLWALWDATGLAGPWRDRALSGGPGAERADADLDAVLALFRAAEQFTDRTVGAGPAAFLDHVLAQDLPADTLAAQGVRAESVQVLTPAAAAGEEWEVVVVAGVQEDVWPDLRLRDSLLGAGALADVEAGRSPDGRRAYAPARREVLDDELRMLAVAVSRATRRLLVTAVLDEEDQPSTFLDLLDPDLDPAAPPRTVSPALDLRGLVAELRGALEETVGADGPGARTAGTAAALLAHLADHGVAGADPATWSGLAPVSTAAPLRPAGPVSVSPSAVELATTCPLRWVLEQAGGRGEASTDQSVGTLVHEIAAAHPHGTAAELRAELARRWPELGLDETWSGRRQRARAEAMVDRLAAYLAGVPGEVDVEREFTADVGRARLRGRMDRVEHTEDGRVRVVDLKTSAHPVTGDRAAEHPQLGAYQVAVEAGAFGDVRPGGGRLVYLGTGRGGPIQRPQPALPDAAEPGWARNLVTEAAETMAGSVFPAQPGEQCRHCPVQSSCPVAETGKRVTE
ncbi:PD-(D/E)XK nuclease family protein [Georgenia sp. TF02-10]|uniref:UrvD/REP family ATP-dependent DNA helicase n=1 Tax=Georgenia sp. TF02-10 TaxID=2917725 RepID=UPI001FA7230A|nr:UrvD/REP family ATP-dependent DNA helicase [Georgenia sp. TF02-10]UNX54159.1 PD-(D/E)XK nuclease family protein [Georgenia sp. TF02-10]